MKLWYIVAWSARHRESVTNETHYTLEQSAYKWKLAEKRSGVRHLREVRSSGEINIRPGAASFPGQRAPASPPPPGNPAPSLSGVWGGGAVAEGG